MVNIPEGNYYFGDGASISSLADSDGKPILVGSEQEISGENISIVNPNSQSEPNPLPNRIETDFPKGFNSFYIMKYEVSQLQYVDFLNTLTYNQQLNRTSSPPSSAPGTYVMINPAQPDSLYRNGIVLEIPGIQSANPAIYAMDLNANGVYFDVEDGLHRAANFLNWADLSAYLDWAGLRPITEMEFEKACRGSNNQPIAGEFAWGTNLITNANSPTNDGTLFEAVSEVPSSGSGLANHGNFVFTEGWGLRGVLRSGFAAQENSTRLEAGASYYGVMELSGNVWEQTIMIAAGGENFTGNFGDGQLAENGDANQPSWCNPSTSSGVLLKGGGWGSTISDVGSWRDLAVSDRFYSHIKPISRRNTVGGRGGR
jgi:formylglycine-generating enzyme required for sulfatase activity